MDGIICLFVIFLYTLAVLHDVTSVLLEPKFIESLIIGSTAGGQILSEDHCKFMLRDIATCSLMRLDDVSMEKLWNLMKMIYKWQLFHTKFHYQLMDITFRHLAAIAQMYPNEKRSLLIDRTKNTLLDFWNSCSDDEQTTIYSSNKFWLEGFHTKISLLIRLGFQALDGSFFAEVDQSYFQDFKDCIGDNIYTKSAEVAMLKKQELAPTTTTSSSATNCVNQLADMLSYSAKSSSSTVATSSDSEEFKPINYKDFQFQFEKNLQQCNILFEDLDVNAANGGGAACSSHSDIGGFVQLNATYSRQNLTEDSASPPTPLNQGKVQLSQNTQAAATNVINKDLLDLYSKLN